VVARTIAGETLIVPVRGGVGDLASIYSLNELGSFLWRHLSSATPLDQLVGLVVDEYEVAREVASRDVQAFLIQMRDAGLVHEISASFPAEVAGENAKLRGMNA
jgi:Coenzyme PQQ synthesis protein D (PqqD)